MNRERTMRTLRRLSRAARIGVRYVASTGRSRENRQLFDSVESYCMFVGYPRSGHTLVGALLDAHAHAVIGFERAAIAYVHAGYDRDRLFQMLLDSSNRGGANRWRSSEYRYDVPNQSQGRFERLQVIGDKQAEGATLRIRARPRLLSRLQRLVGRPRFVHVVRNPFDNITTIATRAARGGKPDLDAASLRYFRLCETVQWITERVDSGDVHVMRHEDFVADPERRLGELCAWLNLEATADYLSDCASIVRASPNPSRFRVSWDENRKRAIRERVEGFSYLQGYEFDTGSDGGS